MFFLSSSWLSPIKVVAESLTSMRYSLPSLPTTASSEQMLRPPKSFEIWKPKQIEGSNYWKNWVAQTGDLTRELWAIFILAMYALPSNMDQHWWQLAAKQIKQVWTRFKTMLFVWSTEGWDLHPPPHARSMQMLSPLVCVEKRQLSNCMRRPKGPAVTAPREWW